VPVVRRRREGGRRRLITVFDGSGGLRTESGVRWERKTLKDVSKGNLILMGVQAQGGEGPAASGKLSTGAEFRAIAKWGRVGGRCGSSQSAQIDGKVESRGP